MAVQAKSGSTQIVHPLPSGKQMLLSCDKCNKKAATAPSKGESYLKLKILQLPIQAGELTQLPVALQLFKQPPLILYLSS